MLTAVFGLTGALVFGSADFLGGLASKRISAVRVTAISAATGLVVLLIATAFAGGTWSPGAMLWGALSGVSGSLAIALLYASLAIGPMSILSPMTAIIGAVVPMAWGLLTGDRFAPIGYAALALALVAVVLVGFVPEKGAVRASARGLLYATGSGILIGAFLIFIHQAPNDSGLIPLVMNRAASSSIMFATIGILAWVRGRSSTARDSSTRAHAGAGWLPGLPLALACGIVDAVGNTLLLIGLRLGDLSVMSVLTAMYPAGTIILAAIVLKERIAPVQWAGLVLATSAAGMLAIA
jgi:drug/metabolite transporter (DMT)-like permease